MTPPVNPQVLDSDIRTLQMHSEGRYIDARVNQSRWSLETRQRLLDLGYIEVVDDVITVTLAGEARLTAERVEFAQKASYPVTAFRDAQLGLSILLMGGIPTLGGGRLDDARVTIRQSAEEASWIEVDVDWPAVSRTEQYAVWKNTGDVYRVGADGAVEDDPIWKPPHHG